MYERRSAGAGDISRIEALVQAFPDRHVHVLDLMYRFCALAPDQIGLVQVWEDDRRDLMGFAVWQPSFKMLDYGYVPGAPGILPEILDWTDRCFSARAGASGSAETCWVKAPAHDSAWTAALESRGFERCAWSISHVELALDAVGDVPAAGGLTIRPVRGEQEAGAWAAAHREIFPRVGLTEAWRLRIMRARSYRPDLDLVAVTPTGEIAGICQGWTGVIGGVRVGEVEPLGTVPAFRHRGLARALLLDLARRLGQDSVSRLFSEPWDDNRTALGVYESSGFRETFRIPTFEKTYLPVSHS